MVRKMELAWNTQKNKMTDVKGKEMEQERKGRIKNDDIDLSRTHLNYDIVQSDKTLYQRVKERVEDLKKSGSRVQKNSVVMYSNILTVPREQAEKWGEKKTDEYFKACYDFFCREFGTENVVSAVVHKDETSPHMHLHFIPVNKENGRLQARIAMNRQRINQIHNELPKFLQERGFDVKRASGKTKDKNIEDVHEYKQVQRKINEKKQELEKIVEILPDTKEKIQYMKKETETVKVGFMKTEEKETGNYILSHKQMQDMLKKINAAVAVKKGYERLIKTDLVQENIKLREIVIEQNKTIEELKTRNSNLQKEKTRLYWENDSLKDQITDLKHEIKSIYKSTREFLKEHTDGLRAFKSLFNELVSKVKEKAPEGEFERLNRVEKRREMDRGMER